MPMQDTYIQDSLELNLFFLRIMKEHALFLQLGFTPKDKPLGDEAENIRQRLDNLLSQAIQLSKGYISPSVMSSEELFTRYTEEAERQTQFFTGVPIDIQLTIDEYSMGGSVAPPVSMQPIIDRLNSSAMALARELLQFKMRVYDNVKSCNIFTNIYPLQIDHIIREAQEYIAMLGRLTVKQLQMGPAELADEEAFWNNIMMEHAEFIDGSLDPTEKALKRKAAGFAVEFERLTQQATSAMRMLQTLPAVTRASRAATQNFSDFKAQGTNGILSCKVKSVIIPLMADHVLREANYYLRILKETLNG